MIDFAALKVYHKNKVTLGMAHAEVIERTIGKMSL